MKNNRAYTLVELLVTIAILGIIAIIALASARNIKDQNRSQPYENYAKSFLIAGKQYNDSYNEDLFGSANSGCKDVTYENLKDHNLIKDIQIKGATCNAGKSEGKSSKIRIRKALKQYTYEVFMKCTKDGKVTYITKNFNSDDGCKFDIEGDKEPPKMQIIIKYNGNVIRPSDCPKITDASKLKVSVEVLDEGSLLASTIKFTYQWGVGTIQNVTDTKNEANYKRTIPINNPSDVVNANNDQKAYIVTIKPISVEDAMGNKTTEDISASFKVCNKEEEQDNTNPKCTVTNSGGTKGNNGWYKSGTVTATGKCTDTGSGCKESSVVIQKVNANTSSSGKTATKDIFDKDGNKVTCKSTIKYDKTNPTCKVTESGGTKGNNGWYKSGTVTATGKCSDNHSGCKDSSITVQKINSNTSKSGTSKTGYIYDKAGNKASCKSTIKYDKSKPSCSISKSNTGTTSGVTLKVTCSENGHSGLNKCAGETSSTVTKKNIKESKTYYVTDKAGNKGECSKSVTKQRQKQTRTWNNCKTKTTTYSCPSGYTSVGGGVCSKSYTYNSREACLASSCHKGGNDCKSMYTGKYACNDRTTAIAKTTCHGGWNDWSSTWKNVSSCSESTSVNCRTIYK